MSPVDWKRRLLDLGCCYPVIGGIQVDVTSVFDREQREVSFCDKNCTTQYGGYDCPAAITLNPGARIKTAAPADQIQSWVAQAREGLLRSHRAFMGADFHLLAERFRIPFEVREAMAECLSGDRVEVNLFGGNPELHPEILPLITQLRADNFQVNLTTTGGRVLREADFANALVDHPPHMLVVSLDDLDVPSFDRLSRMGREDLRREWKQTPALFGQRRKALEALYVARCTEDIPDFPSVRFNLVVSKANLGLARELIERVHATYPKTIVNFYPAQEAFFFGDPSFSDESVPQMEALIDLAIQRTVEGQRIVPRLPYWLMLKAAREDAARSWSGYGLWKCYAAPGANRYVQIGRGNQGAGVHPGGHLGCFWNTSTVTEEAQIESADQVQKFLDSGMRERAFQAPQACPGCAFPRLLFDLVSVQAGMSAAMIPGFVALRQRYAGF